MKERKLTILLALLAALALVFAAGCEDGSGDTYVTYSDEHTVTASQVEALLQSIGNTTVATTSSGTDYWLFGSGSMSETAESVLAGNETGAYYVFSVAAGTASAASASNILTALQGLGLASSDVLTLVGNPCYIDFSVLSETNAATTYWLGGSAPTSTSDGYLKVTVQCAEWYTLPEELETILIKFTPNSTAGWTT